jgi:hypothetical protein
MDAFPSYQEIEMEMSATNPKCAMPEPIMAFL